MMPVFPGAGDASVRLAFGDANGIVQSVDSTNPLPVNIGGATLSLTAEGIVVSNTAATPVPTIEGLAIPEHDYVGMTYTGDNLTGVVYKTGGANGTVVATLTLAYDGSNNLTSITKS